MSEPIGDKPPRGRRATGEPSKEDELLEATQGIGLSSSDDEESEEKGIQLVSDEDEATEQEILGLGQPIEGSEDVPDVRESIEPEVMDEYEEGIKNYLRKYINQAIYMNLGRRYVATSEKKLNDFVPDAKKPIVEQTMSHLFMQNGWLMELIEETVDSKFGFAPSDKKKLKEDNCIMLIDALNHMLKKGMETADENEKFILQTVEAMLFKL